MKKNICPKCGAELFNLLDYKDRIVVTACKNTPKSKCGYQIWAKNKSVLNESLLPAN